MITGKVNATADESRISLVVRGPHGRRRRIEAVVDTGYTGHLTLPPDLIELLQLQWHSVGDAVLGDGSLCIYDTFDAIVVWDGKPVPVYVDQSDCEPLVGMELMQGYEVRINVRPGGKVIIKRLTR